MTQLSFDFVWAAVGQYNLPLKNKPFYDPTVAHVPRQLGHTIMGRVWGELGNGIQLQCNDPSLAKLSLCSVVLQFGCCFYMFGNSWVI